jgi:hypothetical protein
MNKISQFITRNSNIIALCLLVLLFLRTCNSDLKSVNKRLDRLSNKIDSLETITIAKTDLTIEGLKSEKRMIQSTDRKMLDVQRQAAIDAEIKKLEEVK